MRVQLGEYIYYIEKEDKKKKRVLCSIFDTIIYRYRYINTINYKKMPGRKNKNRKSKGHNGTGISRENMYNEVDEFHEQRSQLC